MVLDVAAVCEALAGAVAFVRMARTVGGRPLSASATAPDAIAVVVPVYNEERRIDAALAALAGSGPDVVEILVVDGGSSDCTRERVAACGDPRVRWIEAGPPPAGWNGKAWNLEVGFRRTQMAWVATVDADVACGPGVLAAAAARCQEDDLAMLSVATRQRLGDAPSALVHPALLTTLVYRAGLPNTVTHDPARVQANGQVMVARRDALARIGGFGPARASRCEDVTIARTLAARGERVGFFEGDAAVLMYETWHECAVNWPRSLPLRDRFTRPVAHVRDLAALALAQALPLPTVVLALATGDRFAAGIAGALVIARFGVLAGTRRAYVKPNALYWLSPVFDLPAVVAIVASTLRRRHTWRGRVLAVEGA